MKEFFFFKNKFLEVLKFLIKNIVKDFYFIGFWGEIFLGLYIGVCFICVIN